MSKTPCNENTAATNLHRTVFKFLNNSILFSRMRDIRNAYQIFSENFRDHMGNKSLDIRIILKNNLKRCLGMRTGFNWMRKRISVEL
jgi:hypothetical protein